VAEIQLKGISKSFDDNKVINSLDLSIANGEFITVPGPERYDGTLEFLKIWKQGSIVIVFCSFRG